MDLGGQVARGDQEDQVALVGRVGLGVRGVPVDRQRNLVRRPNQLKLLVPLEAQGGREDPEDLEGQVGLAAREARVDQQNHVRVRRQRQQGKHRVIQVDLEDQVGRADLEDQAAPGDPVGLVDRRLPSLANRRKQRLPQRSLVVQEVREVQEDPVVQEGQVVQAGQEDLVAQRQLDQDNPLLQRGNRENRVVPEDQAGRVDLEALADLGVQEDQGVQAGLGGRLQPSLEYLPRQLRRQSESQETQEDQEGRVVLEDPVDQVVLVGQGVLEDQRPNLLASQEDPVVPEGQEDQEALRQNRQENRGVREAQEALVGPEVLADQVDRGDPEVRQLNLQANLADQEAQEDLVVLADQVDQQAQLRSRPGNRVVQEDRGDLVDPEDQVDLEAQAVQVDQGAPEDQRRRLLGSLEVPGVQEDPEALAGREGRVDQPHDPLDLQEDLEGLEDPAVLEGQADQGDQAVQSNHASCVQQPNLEGNQPQLYRVSLYHQVRRFLLLSVAFSMQ